MKKPRPVLIVDSKEYFANNATTPILLSHKLCIYFVVSWYSGIARRLSYLIASRHSTIKWKEHNCLSERHTFYPASVLIVRTMEVMSIDIWNRKLPCNNGGFIVVFINPWVRNVCTYTDSNKRRIIDIMLHPTTIALNQTVELNWSTVLILSSINLSIYAIKYMFLLRAANVWVEGTWYIIWKSGKIVWIMR